MATYITKLKDRKEVAFETMAFYFEKPEGFTFKAGQHITLKLINPPETDSEGDDRIFSLASAPYEPDLMIATRLRDTAFKRVVRSMPLGSEITLDGPGGSFIMHNDPSRAVVFLAGGIGITPLRSVLLQATHENLPHKIFLFYSNRRPEDAAFFDELQHLSNPNFTLIPTMTRAEQSNPPWRGETDYISDTMLHKYLPPDLNAIYYIAGPETMAIALRKVLEDMGINDDYIRSEEFSGY